MAKSNRKIDFIGIGAPRSGSTWLAQCLYEHPKIEFPGKNTAKKLHPFDKEVNFFCETLLRSSYSQKNRYSKGIDWYLNLFDWEILKK